MLDASRPGCTGPNLSAMFASLYSIRFINSLLDHKRGLGCTGPSRDNKYEQYITVDDSSKATVFNWNVEKTLLRIPTWDIINYN